MTRYSTCSIIIYRRETKLSNRDLTPQEKANKKWVESNRAHRTYLSKRSTARSFINKNAKKEDLLELQNLIEINLKKFK